MHDAGLDHRFGKNTVDRLGKALQAVDDGDQDVGHAAVPQIVHDLEPEFGAFGLLDPKPENVFLARCSHAQHDVDRLVFDHPLIPDFDSERIEKDHRINRFQRPALPFADLIEDRVGDFADQIGGHLGAVEFGQMALDLPHRHAPPIKADDLLVEAIDAGLALGDDHRFERAGTVARYFDLDLAIVRQQRFAARAVAAVARSAACRVPLLIAKVVRQLRTLSSGMMGNRLDRDDG